MLLSIRKVQGQIIQQIHNQVIALTKVDQEVLWLGREHIGHVGYHHHLGLLQNRLQVVVVHILVVTQESYLGSLVGNTCKLLVLDYTLDGRTGKLKIAAINCCLAYVECKKEYGGHGRSVHVFVVCKEINCSATEFWTVVMICPIPV